MMGISMPTFGLGTIKSLLENWTESNDEIQKKYKNCKNVLSDQKKTLDQEINSWGLQLIADIKNHMQQERDALQIQYTHYDNHLERRLANYKTLVEEQTVDEQALHDLKKEFDNLMNQCFQLQNVSKTINFPTTIGIFPFTDQTSENYEVLEVDDNRITTNQSAFESLGADRFTNDGRNPSRCVIFTNFLENVFSD